MIFEKEDKETMSERLKSQMMMGRTRGGDEEGDEAREETKGEG